MLLLLRKFFGSENEILGYGLRHTFLMTVLMTAPIGPSGSAHAFTIEANEYETLQQPEATCRLTLLLPTGHDRFEKRLCGSTLIRSNLILTAAHCVEEFRNLESTPLMIECPKESRVLYGTQVRLPLDWIGENAAFDFALVQLHESARNTRPMRVALDSETVTEALEGQCYISSYGRSSNSPAGRQHTALVKDLRYSTMATKRQKGSVLKTVNRYSWTTPGDSGGSVFCKKTPSSPPILIGVISMVQTTRFRLFVVGWKREAALFAPTTNLSWVLSRL